LIGPEGGFDDPERAAILSAPCVLRQTRPRICGPIRLRVAALALIRPRLGLAEKTHLALFEHHGALLLILPPE
jgi:hypothetical protein